MSDWTYKIINSDCIEAMRGMEDNSIDSIVTDPPYGLSFMGKKWDYDVPGVEVWAECFRILKPGGHLLAFAGTRTQHRMAVRIEDAGFEIRDMIAWVYGSGFPKSLDVSKAIDKAAGAEREVVGQTKANGMKAITKNRVEQGYRKNLTIANYRDIRNITASATLEAKQWNGWGTALKPALEPITVARKPVQGTVADNVLKWGTGGINVYGCRVGTEVLPEQKAGQATIGTFERHDMVTPERTGRFPANFIHDGSDEVVGILNEAARFFYCAKASKAERDAGCEQIEKRKAGAMVGIETREGKPTNHPMGTNHHPTVKPIDLMRYLCRLVTPPGGKVLDPFMGSGTTLLAAYDEGFNCIGIERDSEYAKIAEARVKAYSKQGKINL